MATSFRPWFATPLLLVCACSSPPPAPTFTVPDDPNAAAQGSCARRAPSRRVEALDNDGVGQGIALVRTQSATLAYVADADTQEIRIIDMEQRREIGTQALDGVPSSLLVLRDGRVLVALRDIGRVDVLEPMESPEQGFEERCSIEVATEPVALAVDARQTELLVASRWGHTLTALDTATLSRRSKLEIPRDPTAVMISTDGKKAFVAHATGKGLSVVRLDGELEATTVSSERPLPLQLAPDDPSVQRQERQRIDQAFTLVRAEGNILAPSTRVDPGDGEVTGSPGYGSSFGAMPVMTVIAESQIDPDEIDINQLEGGLGNELGRFGSRSHSRAMSGVCRLPRAAAYDPTDKRLFVACAELEDIQTRVIDNGGFGAEPIQGAKLMTALALDVARRRGIAFSEQGPSVIFFGLDQPSEMKPTTVVLAPHGSTLTAAQEHGRLVFHESESRKVASDGRACASCHMDGRDDGVTWTTEQGPRQTPMLVERLQGTGPYGWDGANKDVEDHLRRTIERLSGRGISASEKADVLAYLGSLHVPNIKEPVARERTLDPLLARGDELFHAKDTGCSTCHLGDEALTDGRTHDVKSRFGKEPVRKFDTPSLRFIGASAPYFHDGRFATLGDLLDGTDGTMGHTSQLSREDRAALETYLKSL